MSGQAPESVKIQIEKTRNKIEKNSAQNEHTKVFRIFKKKLNAADLKWNNFLRNEFLLILDSLRKFVNVSNNGANPRGKKNKTSANYNDEEAKLICEIKKLSNGKFDNIDLKAEIVEINTVFEPYASNQFDDVLIKAEDFDPISDLP